MEEDKNDNGTYDKDDNRGGDRRGTWRNVGSGAIMGALVALIPVLNKYLDNSKEVQLAQIHIEEQVSEIQKTQIECRDRSIAILSESHNLTSQINSLTAEVAELKNELKECKKKCLHS